MPRRSELRITKRAVDALAVEVDDVVFWDRDLPGFGVRVHATGRKVYVVQSRGPSGPKRVTLGRHGDMPADEARKRATVVIDRIKQGEDPLPEPPEPELTVSELSERFMSTHVKVHCKSSTAATYRSILDKHILPFLGDKVISQIGRGEISALHHRLHDTPAMANMAVKLVSRMFSLAEAWARIPVGLNPCGSVRRYRERSREQFLTPEEFRRLGSVLREAEADGSVWPPAIAAIRLLILTGCREDGDPDPSLGRRGPHDGRAEAQRRQGGSPHGSPDRARAVGARRYPSGAGQSLGDHEPEAGFPPA